MAPRVAVLTLTRDRLSYTQDCFNRLRELAGCPFDHYVLDQGSRDGTFEWLLTEHKPHALLRETENIGIHRGMNQLLAQTLNRRIGNYDVIVKFDNDCLLQTEGALRDCAEVAAAAYVCSPRIEGLNTPPPVVAETTVQGHRFGRTAIIGGIFTACPASLFQRFLYDETAPLWGSGEPLCEQGFYCGYLLDHTAWHIETTAGQHARYPEYFAQKRAEGCPC